MDKRLPYLPTFLKADVSSTEKNAAKQSQANSRSEKQTEERRRRSERRRNSRAQSITNHDRPGFRRARTSSRPATPAYRGDEVDTIDTGHPSIDEPRTRSPDPESSVLSSTNLPPSTQTFAPSLTSTMPSSCSHPTSLLAGAGIALLLSLLIYSTTSWFSASPPPPPLPPSLPTTQSVTQQVAPSLVTVTAPCYARGTDGEFQGGLCQEVFMA